MFKKATDERTKLRASLLNEAQAGNLNIVKSINDQEESEHTALTWAIERGCLPVVEYIQDFERNQKNKYSFK